MEEKKEKPEKEKKKKPFLGCTVDETVHSWYREQAFAKKTRMSNLIRSALDLFMLNNTD